MVIMSDDERAKQIALNHYRGWQAHDTKPDSLGVAELAYEITAAFAAIREEVEEKYRAAAADAIRTAQPAAETLGVVKGLTYYKEMCELLELKLQALQPTKAQEGA
jgi:hypothetical protein